LVNWFKLSRFLLPWRLRQQVQQKCSYVSVVDITLGWLNYLPCTQELVASTVPSRKEVSILAGHKVPRYLHCLAVQLFSAELTCCEWTESTFILCLLSCWGMVITSCSNR
jgi:hypothetical protein